MSTPVEEKDGGGGGKFKELTFSALSVRFCCVLFRVTFPSSQHITEKLTEPSGSDYVVIHCRRPWKLPLH